MAVLRKIIDATLIIDNNVVGYVSNSLSFTEGLGEQKFRTQVSGGGAVQHIITDDFTKKVSTVKFTVEPTAANVALFRAIKANQDGHVVTISATDFTRTITGAIITKDYEVKFGSDDVMDIEMTGNAAI